MYFKWSKGLRLAVSLWVNPQACCTWRGDQDERPSHVQRELSTFFHAERLRADICFGQHLWQGRIQRGWGGGCCFRPEPHLFGRLTFNLEAIFHVLLALPPTPSLKKASMHRVNQDLELKPALCFQRSRPQ